MLLTSDFSINSVADRISNRVINSNLLLSPGQAGWQIKENRITLTFRKWDKDKDKGKWRFDKVPYTFHKHREWHGTISHRTIKRDNCGVYWLCITTDFTDTEPLSTTGQNVGADFGMKDAYLTLSTGEKIQHPQPLKQSLTKLRSLNKALSRNKKVLTVGGVLLDRSHDFTVKLPINAKIFIGNLRPIFVKSLRRLLVKP